MSAIDARPTGHTHQIHTFQLRLGRMSDRHRRAVDQLLPIYGVTLDDLPDQASSSGFSGLPEQAAPVGQAALFGRVAPLVLEIGSGMGESTVKMAEADPDRNYLAVEVHIPGIANLVQLIADRGLTNIRVFNGDALELIRKLPPDSLAAIHIFFPDPWPKVKHHKRRLVQPSHMALLRSRLMRDGIVHCATDWAEYATVMMAALSADPGLINSFDGYAPRPDYRPVTKFEQRGIDAGREIFDLVFRRTDEPPTHHARIPPGGSLDSDDG